MKNFMVIFVLMLIPIVSSAATHQVDMVGLTFVPDTLTINQGDSVLWVNTSAIVHTTTSGVNGIPDGYWDSGSMAANDSFAFHFDSAGAFPYYCIPHWALGMIGLVVVTPTGIVENESGVSAKFAVGQAYPNPFDQAVRIDYSLGAPGQVRVGIYDQAGQLIRTLAEAAMTDGLHSAVWDGQDNAGRRVASGAYFMEISINGTRVQRKVLLLR